MSTYPGWKSFLYFLWLSMIGQEPETKREENGRV